MAEYAYDSLVGELLWSGIQPNYALKLAAQLYPDEELIIREKATLEAYIEIAMDLWTFKYDEFNIDDTYDFPPISDIRKRNSHKRVWVYIDGANLLRSFAFINETATKRNNYTDKTISIKLENYKPPAINKYYPVWYLSYILWPVFGFDAALIDKVVFVMCADTVEAKTLLRKIKRDFGFAVVSPEKNGTGFKSSTNEDKYLKDLILSDLKNDVFDVAIIATGDGNSKDGISFPAIARQIQDNKKEVSFAGFNLTASKKIKEYFKFDELSVYPMFPRGDNPEIVGLSK